MAVFGNHVPDGKEEGTKKNPACSPDWYRKDTGTCYHYHYVLVLDSFHWNLLLSPTTATLQRLWRYSSTERPRLVMVEKYGFRISVTKCCRIVLVVLTLDSPILSHTIPCTFRGKYHLYWWYQWPCHGSTSTVEYGTIH